MAKVTARGAYAPNREQHAQLGLAPRPGRHTPKTSNTVPQPTAGSEWKHKRPPQLAASSFFAVDGNSALFASNAFTSLSTAAASASTARRGRFFLGVSRPPRCGRSAPRAALFVARDFSSMVVDSAW